MDCDTCKYQDVPGFKEPCVECGIDGDFYEEYKMTNYERIISMNIEKMAEFLHTVTETCAGNSCKGCPMHDVKKMTLICNSSGIKRWLESEVEEQWDIDTIFTK